MMERKDLDFEDKLLVCQDCGADFLFDSGEQFFYWSKKLQTPKRCPDCRRRRKLTIVPEVRQ